MFKDKIKALILNKEQGDSKKKIENIVVFIVILIVTVVAINSIWSGNKDEQEQTSTNKQLASENLESTNNTNEEDSMEKNLEMILSSIDGVGDVKVLITYSETSEVVAMYNENSKNSQIEEKDSGRRNPNNNTNRFYKRYNI